MYQFCTRIQVKQIKTEIINKDGEKDFPRISGKYFIQKIVHTTINTENHYCGPKTIWALGVWKNYRRNPTYYYSMV